MLRDFLVRLFATEGKPGEIAWLNVWHITYAAVIFAATFVTGYFYSKKSDAAKDKLLRALACAITFTYVLDFFVQPLMDNGAGMMNVDKLPFHICTLLAIVVPFVQFNKRLAFLAEPVSVLAIVGPMMYLVYPGGAVGDISPFCYKIVQTFIYHGLVFAWGFLMIATGKVKPSLKDGWWRVLVSVSCVAVWASIGNLAYNSNLDGASHYDWFFLTGSTFPFVPKALMPLTVIISIFGVAMMVYGIYYAFVAVRDGLQEKNEEYSDKKENAAV